MSDSGHNAAAVIGLGPHGHRMVEALAALGKVRLAAVVDNRDDALASPLIGSETVRCRSMDELWRVGPLDLICIATNGPSHAELAIEGMNHGARRLLIAKPMACSLAECDRIIERARATESRVAVDHIRRHSPVYLWLRDRIMAGVWGELRCVWTQRPGIGLGCLATHSFDAVRMLARHDVCRVTAWVDQPIRRNPRGEQFIDPGGVVVLEFDQHVRAVVAQIEDGAGPASIEIDLTAGRVRLDEKSGAIEVFERDLSVIPAPGRPAVYHQMEVPVGLTAKVDMHQGLVAMLAELLGDGPLQADAVHGRASIEVLAAAYLSHERGNMPIILRDDGPALANLWMPVT